MLKIGLNHEDSAADFLLLKAALALTVGPFSLLILLLIKCLLELSKAQSAGSLKLLFFSDTSHTTNKIIFTENVEKPNQTS